eukprot:6575273-Prymnesium_polylepis.1
MGSPSSSSSCCGSWFSARDHRSSSSAVASHPAPRAGVYSAAGEPHTGAWCNLACQVYSAAR